MRKFTYFLASFMLVGSMVFAQGARTYKPAQNLSEAQLLQMEQEMLQKAPRTPDGKIRCFTTEADQLLRARHPELGSLEDFEKWLAPKIEEYKKNAPKQKVVLTIPVIVHVVHNGDNVGSGENISAAQVYSQIDVLNEDFRKMAGTRGDGNGVDVEIEFCLATEDPNGVPLAEPGIDRYNGGQASWTSTSSIDGTLKPATSWDPTQYFNMWTVRFGGSASGLLGYAQFPNNSGLPGLSSNNGAANTDGVVIGYNYFGSSDKGSFALSAPYDKGRTATHEVGHCFGLRHIWGDGPCGTDDYCADTPESDAANYGCPTGHVSCGTTDQIENYMDYTDDACMNMFTQNQKDRVMTVMTNSPRRNTLPSSTKCGAPALNADFSANVTVINAGQSVTFTDASSGPNTITAWSWNFDVTGIGGTSSSTASTQGPHTITYNTAGTFTVSLQVTDNTSATDTETKTGYIVVNPAGTQICDSTGNFDPVSHTPSLIGSSGWGWISGHNNYDDRAKAEKFNAPQAGYALEATKMWFAKAYAGSPSSTVTITVWDNSGTGGAPGTILASEIVPISSLNVYPNETRITFSSPVTIPTSAYYIGVQFAANGTPQDSIALVHNADGETTPATAWEKWNTGSWYQFSDATNSWGINTALAIWPVVCNSPVTGISNIAATNTVNIYPNPSTGIININVTEKSQVTIYNIVGEIVYTNNIMKNTAVDLSNQPNGVFFINVTSGNTTTTKKVVLSK